MRKEIFVGTICLLAILFISGCTSSSKGDNIKLDSDSVEVNPVNKFQGQGISFDYPGNWKIDNSDNSDTEKIVSLESNIARLSVYKKEYKYDVEKCKESWEEIFLREGSIKSVKSLTIDSWPGYEITGTYSEPGEQQVICFVKDGVSYHLIITTNSIDDIQSDIDTVVNSFKVK